MIAFRVSSSLMTLMMTACTVESHLLGSYDRIKPSTLSSILDFEQIYQEGIQSVKVDMKQDERDMLQSFHQGSWNSRMIAKKFVSTYLLDEIFAVTNKQNDTITNLPYNQKGTVISECFSETRLSQNQCLTQVSIHERGLFEQQTRISSLHHPKSFQLIEFNDNPITKLRESLKLSTSYFLGKVISLCTSNLTFVDNFIGESNRIGKQNSEQYINGKQPYWLIFLTDLPRVCRPINEKIHSTLQCQLKYRHKLFEISSRNLRFREKEFYFPSAKVFLQSDKINNYLQRLNKLLQAERSSSKVKMDQIMNLSFYNDIQELGDDVNDEIEIINQVFEFENVFRQNATPLPIQIPAESHNDLNFEDFEEEDFEEFDEDDSDSFSGSYENFLLLDRSPLPRRSPSPNQSYMDNMNNAYAMQDFDNQVILDFRIAQCPEYFQTSEFDPSEDDDSLQNQTGPNN